MTANNKFTQQLCNGRPATEALTTVPNDVFVRVARRYLALPDTGAQTLEENQTITPDRREPVDQYACVLSDCRTWGAANHHWKRRHDMAEHTVMHMARQYRYRLRRQVLNLFAGCVPTNVRDQYNRGPQCMIVDTVDEERASNGVGFLGDFKTIQNPIGQASRRGGHKKETWEPLEARQKQVNSDAKSKAARQDRHYNGTQRGQTGPIQRRFTQLAPVEGYVVGPYGGVSTHLARLIQRIAKKGATTLHWNMGLADPNEAFSIIYNRCMRVMGISNQMAHAVMIRDMVAEAAIPKEARRLATTRRNYARQAFQHTVARQATRAGWDGPTPYGFPDTWAPRRPAITRVDTRWVYAPV